MGPAMGPDGEMAEAETDVSKGVQRELRRVGTRGGLGLGEAGADDLLNLQYGSSLTLLHKKLVIEVPGH